MPHYATLLGFLGLGSNMGDPVANVRQALSLLAARLPEVTASPVYRTEPQGLRDQDWFANCVAQVAVPAQLSPLDLLGIVREVETAMGRERTLRWGPRVIDVDILLVDGWTMQSDELQIPHPRLCERAFVLVPLQDLAPAIRIAGRTPAQWLAGLRYAVSGDRIQQAES